MLEHEIVIQIAEMKSLLNTAPSNLSQKTFKPEPHPLPFRILQNDRRNKKDVEGSSLVSKGKRLQHRQRRWPRTLLFRTSLRLAFPLNAGRLLLPSGLQSQTCCPRSAACGHCDAISGLGPMIPCGPVAHISTVWGIEIKAYRQILALMHDDPLQLEAPMAHVACRVFTNTAKVPVISCYFHSPPRILVPLVCFARLAAVAAYNIALLAATQAPVHSLHRLLALESRTDPSSCLIFYDLCSHAPPLLCPAVHAQQPHLLHLPLYPKKFELMHAVSSCGA